MGSDDGTSVSTVTQLFTWLAGIALALTITLAAIALLFASDGWSGWLQQLSGVTGAFPAGEAARLLGNLREYLMGNGHQLIEEASFTNPERHHFMELRDLWQQGEWLLYFSGSIALLAGGTALYREPGRRRQVMQRWADATAFNNLMIAGLGLMVISIDFSGTFVALHHLLFSRFGWVFASDSTSVRLFPSDYFLFLAIGTCFVLLLSAVLLKSADR